MSLTPGRLSHVELKIGAIRTVIIDPHNEILPYWFMEFLRRKSSLIAVRIDAHHDMFHCCPSLPAGEGRDRDHFLVQLLPYLKHYSRSMVNEGNFTCPAFHYGVVRALYHFHPGLERLESYGRASGVETQDTPRTVEKRLAGGSKWLFWDGEEAGLRGGRDQPKATPFPRHLSLKDFRRDMQDCLLPVAVGFDLDGLYGNQDRGPVEDIVMKRMAGIRAVLECIPQPVFICLARSQNPRSYIPAGAVERVQEAALGLIREVYSTARL